MSYEASLKHKRDAENVFNSAKKSGEALGHAKGLAEGKAKGLAEGKAKGLAEGLAEGERRKAVETAKAFKEMGLPTADIAKGTGLSVEEIENSKVLYGKSSFFYIKKVTGNNCSN
ncbi:hypothetical protein KUH03_40405 [Sphingobacterium sp. E70]|uniref:hypothetical protein n=1 Tax=Sphingobacterium sp. E70 TaxID=2853439 RepID=UPI00211BD351|nr:hypothetical protein [Sphingobacterium sp. E70]ULT25055.1 hypothetical protein KUH03_40405 [Sphingobacterium sp. E70]